MAAVIIITDELRYPIRIGDVMVLQHEVEENPDVVQSNEPATERLQDFMEEKRNN